MIGAANRNRSRRLPACRPLAHERRGGCCAFRLRSGRLSELRLWPGCPWGSVGGAYSRSFAPGDGACTALLAQVNLVRALRPRTRLRGTSRRSPGRALRPWCLRVARGRACCFPGRSFSPFRARPLISRRVALLPGRGACGSAPPPSFVFAPRGLARGGGFAGFPSPPARAVSLFCPSPLPGSSVRPPRLAPSPPVLSSLGPRGAGVLAGAPGAGGAFRLPSSRGCVPRSAPGAPAPCRSCSRPGRRLR